MPECDIVKITLKQNLPECDIVKITSKQNLSEYDVAKLTSTIANKEANMTHVLDWNKLHHRFFEEMTRIPHGSEHEEKYAEYLVEYAKSKGFAWKQYPLGTVVIYKGATEGYEDHPGVILQAHMDMVCEKNDNSDHDFSKDPLKLRIEDGWLYATGTTLGADDGMGVAYMLAVLGSDDIPHPPLECIFTVREETDLSGAAEVAAEDIKGRRFIGLDDMEGGWLSMISSAGGQCFVGNLEYQTEAAEAGAQGYKMMVGGLLGGHSGVDIASERGNAINLGGRALKMLKENLGVRLASAKAGLVDNAIPREFFAEFRSFAEEAEIRDFVAKLEAVFKDELAVSDAGVFLTLEKTELEKVWDEKSSDKYIDFLCMVPTGIRHKSMAVEGLTAASENLAIVSCKESVAAKESASAKDGVDTKDSASAQGGVATTVISMRADRDSWLDKMGTELGIIADLFDMDYVIGGYYPGWAYEPNSFMREKLRENVKVLMGKDLVTEAVHGGLETGFFKQKWPDVDIVVFGAKCRDYHTPEESMNMESFDKCFELLKMMLASL